ncbi:MAG TPA: small-conductance mechanosensitive ion channel [Burkholderiales bacterium]
MFTTVTDWSEAVLTSLAGALALFFAAIPKVIAFAVILVVGWILAGLVAGAVGVILRRVRFNDLSARSGFSGFVANVGVAGDSAGFLASVAKWFIRLIVLVVAFDALGLPAVSDVLRQLLLWLPNLAVGIVVLIIGGLLANAAFGIVRGATSSAGFRHPDLIANVARVSVWVFAIIVAVNQIGVAQTLVNTLFMGAVALVTLALGLAFGLGGRDLAARLLQKWYDEGQEQAPKIAAAGQRMVEPSQTLPAGGSSARGYSAEENG